MFPPQTNQIDFLTCEVNAQSILLFYFCDEQFFNQDTVKGLPHLFMRGGILMSTLWVKNLKYYC